MTCLLTLRLTTPSKRASFPFAGFASARRRRLSDRLTAALTFADLVTDASYAKQRARKQDSQHPAAVGDRKWQFYARALASSTEAALAGSGESDDT